MKMAAKKEAVKKTSRKKDIVKKEVIKPKELTPFEEKVFEQIDILKEKGFSVCLKCEDRNLMINETHDVLSYIRQYKVLNLIGLKSGCPAETIHVR